LPAVLHVASEPLVKQARCVYTPLKSFSTNTLFEIADKPLPLLEVFPVFPASLVDEARYVYVPLKSFSVTYVVF
jgi:hypothetical protein